MQRKLPDARSIHKYTHLDPNQMVTLLRKFQINFLLNGPVTNNKFFPHSMYDTGASSKIQQGKSSEELPTVAIRFSDLNIRQYSHRERFFKFFIV